MKTSLSCPERPLFSLSSSYSDGRYFVYPVSEQSPQKSLSLPAFLSWQATAAETRLKSKAVHGCRSHGENGIGHVSQTCYKAVGWFRAPRSLIMSSSDFGILSILPFSWTCFLISKIGIKFRFTHTHTHTHTYEDFFPFQICFCCHSKNLVSCDPAEHNEGYNI